MSSFGRYLFFVGATSTAMYMIYKFIKARQQPEEHFLENFLGQMIEYHSCCIPESHSYATAEIVNNRPEASNSDGYDIPKDLPAESSVDYPDDISEKLQQTFQKIPPDDATDANALAGIVTIPAKKKRKRFHNLRKMFRRMSCVRKAD